MVYGEPFRKLSTTGDPARRSVIAAAGESIRQRLRSHEGSVHSHQAVAAWTIAHHGGRTDDRRRRSDSDSSEDADEVIAARR